MSGPSAPQAGRRRVLPLLAAAVGVGLVGVLLLGPEIAPHTATATVGPPYAPPGVGGLLGTDHLGRDVWARLLHGGRALVLTSVVAAVAGSVVGGVAGIGAALARRRWTAPALLRPLDTLVAVPPVLLALLVLAALPGQAGLLLAVVATGAPITARVAYAAAEQVRGRGHVEVAVARGETRSWLLFHEILPLLAPTLVADLGVRFVAAVYLVAAAGFLGLAGTGADWGLQIVEALPGAALQPWALLAPVVALAGLAVAANRWAERRA